MASPSGMPMPAYQPPYMPYPQQSKQDFQSAGFGSGYSTPTNTLQPSHIRASLLSAVEDRIRQRLADKIGTPFAELQSVNANLQELRLG